MYVPIAPSLETGSMNNNAGATPATEALGVGVTDIDGVTLIEGVALGLGETEIDGVVEAPGV